MVKCLSNFVRNQTLCQLNLLGQARLVASSFLRHNFGSYFLKSYSHMLPAVLFLLQLSDVHFIFFHELKNVSLHPPL
jgi:hypothetical protein